MSRSRLLRTTSRWKMAINKVMEDIRNAKGEEILLWFEIKM